MRNVRQRRVGLLAILFTLGGWPFLAHSQTAGPPNDSTTTASLQAPAIAPGRPAAGALQAGPGPRIAPPRGRLVERPPHDLPPWGLVGLLGPDRNGAIPASKADRAPDVFKKMDTNEDGVISWDRSLPPKPMRKRTDTQILGFFKSMDADQNGKLSAAELGVTEKRFRELDADGSGFVTAQEYVAGIRASQDRTEREIQENRRIALSLLATLDADRDGKITRSEFGGLGALLKNQDLTGKGFVALEDLLRLSAQESPTTSTLTP